jgi:hypothetical protein
MTVYHGSYTVVKQPEVLIGRNIKDFGPGFSCTPAALKCLDFVSSEEALK